MARVLRPLPLPFLLLALLLAGCGDGSSPTPSADPPRVTVSGVEAEGSYDGPVTITVQVDPADASVSIELNGDRFTSGSTVSQPGDYLLSVEAVRAGLRTEVNVPFRLVLGGDRRLIVRMLDLGPEGLGGGGDEIGRAHV